MTIERKPGFCTLCRSRCGQVAVVEDGRLVAVEPDPAHPTGAALCIKGRAAPELVASGNRILHPLRRTAPKGAADPGWQRIAWTEALAEAHEHVEQWIQAGTAQIIIDARFVLLKFVDIALGEIAAGGVECVDITVEDFLRQRVVERHVAVMIVADDVSDETRGTAVFRSWLEVFEGDSGRIGRARGAHHR